GGGGYASVTSGFPPFPVGLSPIHIPHSTGPVLALHGTVPKASFPQSPSSQGNGRADPSREMAANQGVKQDGSRPPPRAAFLIPHRLHVWFIIAGHPSVQLQHHGIFNTQVPQPSPNSSITA
ncbi:hypothetical protein B0H67DRAFT_144044, partial [Lasiosphaeris hirsuta]